MDQHWVFYPLTITKKISNQDGTIKLSAMGEDFTKYGYEEIKESMIDIENSSGAYPYSLEWKNEYGNRDTATQWSNINSGDYNGSFLDSWDLWGASSFCGTSIQSLRKSKITRKDIDKETDLIIPIAKEYIENKLALY
jgi:hypothetical protein